MTINLYIKKRQSLQGLAAPAVARLVGCVGVADKLAGTRAGEGRRPSVADLVLLIAAECEACFELQEVAVAVALRLEDEHAVEDARANWNATSIQVALSFTLELQRA